MPKRKGIMKGFPQEAYDPERQLIDVSVQSETSNLFHYYLMQELNTEITLTADVSANSDVINVSAGHGIIVGNHVVVVQGDTFTQQEVVAVATNAITLAMPVPFDFSASAAKVICGNIHLNLDGSSTPIDAYFRFYDAENGAIPVDIETAKIWMSHAAAGNGETFGDIDPATVGGYGQYIRKENGSFINLGNYKKNSDFEDFGGDVAYTDKAGPSKYGTNVTFKMFDIYRQEVRFYPQKHDTPDLLHFKIRGNLSSFYDLRFSIMGSFTEGEQ